jgi:hypothetical protein
LVCSVRPMRRLRRATWVSTGMPGTAKALPRTTLAVLRPMRELPSCGACYHNMPAGKRRASSQEGNGYHQGWKEVACDG